MSSSAPGTESRRRDMDIMKLIKSKHEVIMGSNPKKSLRVKFHGPKETLYEGGVWLVEVILPDQYPFLPPSIRFINMIYHPNVCEYSGLICLDVLHEAWTPLYDLSNIFESFLPQLLTYPNSSHPVNDRAAGLSLTKPDEYNEKVKQFVVLYASEDALKEFQDKPRKETERSDSESSMSDSTEDENEKAKE